MKSKNIIILLALLLMIVTVVSAIPKQFTVREGWNLVTFQVIDQIPTQFSEDYKIRLYFLDPNTKEYVGGTIKEAESSLLGLSESEFLLSGFWIYTNTDFDVNVRIKDKNDVGEARELQELNDFFDSQEQHLNEGWNLLAIHELMLDNTLEDVKGTCNFQSVYHFERNQWFKQSDGDLIESFTQDSIGHSLAVKVSDTCKLDFEEDSEEDSDVPEFPS